MTAGKRMRRIATEEAFATADQMEALRRVIESGRRDADTPFWSMMLNGGGNPFAIRVLRQLLDIEEERVAIMDAEGVDMHVLALTSPGVQTLPVPEAVAMARRTNDLMAELVRRRPDRFAALATVSPQAPAEAAKEIERAVGSLGLSGVMVNSHTDDEYLDEEKYLPIFEAASALDTPIYIHPRGPSSGMAAPYLKYGLETAIWGYGAETGLHGVRLLVSGILDRHPNLRIILGHMGEGIPFWLWRLNYMHAHGRNRPPLRHPLDYYFRENFVITTSGMNWSAALKFCIDAIGADKVMWAIDYPYQETPGAVEFMDTADISEEDRAKIYAGNAERVFKLKALEDAAA